jgi:hypothetical protein
VAAGAGRGRDAAAAAGVSPCFLECLKLVLPPADDEGSKARLVLHHALKTVGGGGETRRVVDK